MIKIKMHTIKWVLQDSIFQNVILIKSMYFYLFVININLNRDYQHVNQTVILNDNILMIFIF